MIILKIISAIILVPLLGGFLSGLDRIITARMQGRKGPPLLQPFYDVLKLFSKETIEVNSMHRFYVYISFIFAIFTTLIMTFGGDILLIVFSLTLVSIFFILGGYSSNSPYSLVGAQRELLQVMAYEPAVLLASIALYYVDNSFNIDKIILGTSPAIFMLPGVFISLVYVLTFKLRKSPFDLSTSHHGHQEIVKGITTEYSGRDLAIIEITHWFETVIALMFVFVFIAYAPFYSKIIAFFVCILVYFLEIIIDNSFARVKWQLALKSSWIVTLIFAASNFIILSFVM